MIVALRGAKTEIETLALTPVFSSALDVVIVMCLKINSHPRIMTTDSLA